MNQQLEDDPQVCLVRRACRHIEAHLDDTLTPRYPRGIPNRLVVTLTDGRKLTKEVEFPRGHAGNPMTDAEVEAKFRALVEPRYGRPTADAVLAKCWKFEEAAGAADVLGLLGER